MEKKIRGLPNAYDKTKTEKYVIVPDRATVVTFDDLCEQIATVSGVNNGLARHVLYGLVSSMKTFIRQGHSVQVDGFGTFIPSFNAKSSLVEEEANIDSIIKTKLRFLPCAELREVINSMEFEFDAADSTNDSQAETETDPEGGTDSPGGI